MRVSRFGSFYASENVNAEIYVAAAAAVAAAATQRTNSQVRKSKAKRRRAEAEAAAEVAAAAAESRVCGVVQELDDRCRARVTNLTLSLRKQRKCERDGQRGGACK